MPENPVVARAGLHFFEEPCISGKEGSGAIFFSGCSLRCEFCQNKIISAEHFGKEISIKRLAEIFYELEQQGANNINLVTATHYSFAVIEALKIYKPKIPIVYNCGGYEKPETLKALEGYIDIYLPDFKYYSSELAEKFSSTPDYFEVAKEAIKEMFRQTGKPVFNEKGIMQKGTIIRHLVLPSHTDDSIKILDTIKNEFPDYAMVSLMRQYTPYSKSKFRELNRKLTSYEYDKVSEYMIDLGIINGYMQDKDSARTLYTPDFDLTGVE